MLIFILQQVGVRREAATAGRRSNGGGGAGGGGRRSRRGRWCVITAAARCRKKGTG